MSLDSLNICGTKIGIKVDRSGTWTEWTKWTEMGLVGQSGLK